MLIKYAKVLGVFAVSILSAILLFEVALFLLFVNFYIFFTLLVVAMLWLSWRVAKEYL